MSYQAERDQFIATTARLGLPLPVATALLRAATTLQRLAVAQCNGDWPADNGERRVVQCARCERYWVPAVVLKGGCADCRAEARAHAAVVGTGWTVTTQGDPRGYVLRILPLHGDPDRDPIGVPTRDR
jgi:hypothetical protein